MRVSAFIAPLCVLARGLGVVFLWSVARVVGCVCMCARTCVCICACVFVCVSGIC